MLNEKPKFGAFEGKGVLSNLILRLGKLMRRPDKKPKFNRDEFNKIKNQSRRVKYLQRVDLMGANLRFSILICDILAKVDLRGADLMGSIFWGSNLFCTDLRGANLLDADLKGAILEGALLTNAVLNSADLRGVVGLTQEQVDSAVVDEFTKLPKGLINRAFEQLKEKKDV